MTEYIEFFKKQSGKSEEWLNTYQQIGGILANELMWGGYIVAKGAEKGRFVDNRLKNDSGLVLNLYDADNGSAYACYSWDELLKVLDYLGLQLNSKYTEEDTFFSLFPVSEYMQLFDELCPRRGIVVDDCGEIFTKIEVDDTEFFTEQWFEGFDEHYEDEDGDVNNLACMLSTYVNGDDPCCFEFYNEKSQWEAFCEWTGYLKREDYFGVLSDNPDYQYLFQNDTYLSKEDALKKIEKHLETLDKQLKLEGINNA